jgi:mRNA-degrading endonuclease toxin of MazEF toxin-antitoxin module
MSRAKIWLAQVGRKTRPVLILTCDEVINVRRFVTVAEITTQRRGLAAEVAFDHAEVGLREPSVVNFDGIHTVPQVSLTHRVGELDDDTMRSVCQATAYALGC